jgi:hypothetical protein
MGNENNPKIKTSMIVPFDYIYEKDEKPSTSIQGVINFESNRQLYPSYEDKIEYKSIVQAIAELIHRFDAHYRQLKGTDNVVKKLRYKLNECTKKPFPKNKIFLAYPHLSDTKVIDSIKKVIKLLGLDFEDWKENNTTGSISNKTVSDIVSCKYGICYFSEKVDNEYKDNSNIMFEAGLMHASSYFDKKIKWIPIRECKTSDMPFDIQDLNMILIDRKNGNLNEIKLKEDLGKRLGELIDS